jgi:hypothetical protein
MLFGTSKNQNRNEFARTTFVLGSGGNGCGANSVVRIKRVFAVSLSGQIAAKHVYGERARNY